MKKKLITQDIISSVIADLANEASLFGPYQMQYADMFAIGMIMIVKTGDTYYLNVPEELSKDYVSSWMSDVGKLFTRTLRKKRYELLMELRTPDYKTILRKVEPDEEEDIKEKGLDHVVVGDFSYTIIKRCPVKCPYSTFENDYDEVMEAIEQRAAGGVLETKEEDEEEAEMTSVSLF